MRVLRRVSVVGALFLLASSCASATVETQVAPAAEAAATTVAPVEVAVPTGREALVLAEGEPYALWFWGAH
ncbi:MAG: hypothetical protein HKN94_08280 [Acidimicrobiales bacterium]|nr:hypothetical protein [Acidimicrobiia bacterium]NNC80133.1 hypothetical protein [Acidimicrobiales bacterium]